jgi:hypothetical protein
MSQGVGVSALATRSGKPVVPDRQLARGGQGAVFSLANDPHVVFKRYHEDELAKDPRLEDRIVLMQRLDPAGAHEDRSGHMLLAWPLELVYERSRFVGFLMPAVDVQQMVEMHRVTDPSDRLRANGRTAWLRSFTWRYLTGVAKNLALGTELLHASDVVIGDFNDRNVAVSNEARVTLLDCDSMQIVDPSNGERFLCRVKRAEFLAPELANVDLREWRRPVSSDLFALAVHLHQLLLQGEHPFRGDWRGSGDHPREAQLAARGLWTYGGFSEIASRRSAVAIEMLPARLIEMFRVAFVDGATKPEDRPTAAEWRDALEDLDSDLRQCRANGEHWYSHAVKRCPWCEHEAHTLLRQERLPPLATPVASAGGGTGTATASGALAGAPGSPTREHAQAAMRPVAVTPFPNVRHALGRLSRRLRLAIVGVAVGGFYAGSYTFSSEAAKPNGLGDGLLWCGSSALLALLVALLYDATLGPARADGAARDMTITALFTAAGIGLWGLSFRGADPSQLGWLAPPLLMALGHGIALAWVGSSRAGRLLRLVGALLAVLVGLGCASTVLAARTPNSSFAGSPLTRAFEPIYEGFVELVGVGSHDTDGSSPAVLPVKAPSASHSPRTRRAHHSTHRASRRPTSTTRGSDAHAQRVTTANHASSTPAPRSSKSAEKRSTTAPRQVRAPVTTSQPRHPRAQSPKVEKPAQTPRASGPGIEGGAERGTPATEGSSGIQGSTAPESGAGGSGSGISGGAG